MQTKLVSIATSSFALMIAIAIAGPAAMAQKDGTPNVDTPRNQTAILDSHVKEILIYMKHDGKGTVSQEQFMELMKAEFNKLDRDQSGLVDARQLPNSNSHVVPSARYGK
jgi:hypothetical protein